MSAVPKKKLCWNCDGNVTVGIGNCPYCGVYLQPEEEEERSFWRSASAEKTKEIPAPLYQLRSNDNDETDSTVQDEEDSSTENESPFSFLKFKQDVFAILFLMVGSVFFLFGLILFLFSSGGKFTLEWNGDLWIFFLLSSTPLLYFGWKYLQQVDSQD